MITNPVASTSSKPDENDFLARVGHCETSYDVFRLLKAICAAFGFSHFSSINKPTSDDQKLSELSVVSNWPPELINAYDELELFKNSPIVERLRATVEPVIWEIEELYAVRPEQERKTAIELFRDFEMESGVYFSVHTAKGDLGAISFSGMRDEPSKSELMELNFLSIAIYEKLKQFEIVKSAPEFTLAPREQECLNWTAAGKTSAEIALILDLSEHTVNHYLGSICQKLNAQNRAHAVSKAMRLKLLN